jgi:hypothetical protein
MRPRKPPPTPRGRRQTALVPVVEDFEADEAAVAPPLAEASPEELGAVPERRAARPTRRELPRARAAAEIQASPAAFKQWTSVATTPTQQRKVKIRKRKAKIRTSHVVRRYLKPTRWARHRHPMLS